MRTAVIGAGPAGLTAAYQLAKRGVEVHVYEAADQVGGMARSLSLWGQTVDIGPHRFFSDDLRVNRFWLEVVGRDYAMVDRLTRIYYNKKFFHYPLEPLNSLTQLGVFETFYCGLSYLWQKCLPKSSEPSFEQWVKDRFGQRLFQIFFKSYSEKLWGIPCSELDADFAAQRIRKLSLFQVAKSALFGNGGHRTLVDKFAYPKQGTGSVYERMATFVEGNGGKVFLSTAIKGIQIEKGKTVGLVLSNGNSVAYDHVVSTMPMTVLAKSIAAVPNAVATAIDSLTYRNTIVVYLHVEGGKLFPDNWLYVHAPDLKMGRVTNFKNWVPDINNGAENSILALEYWCNDNDAMWKEDDQKLIDLAKSEIRKAELIGKQTVLAGKVIRIPRCYPVYRRGYKAHVNTIAQFLKGISNLSLIGRYGSFKYNNQDHSILMGLLAAENIALGAKHDLWSVNSDYDSYQEKALITETGLDTPMTSIPPSETEKLAA